MDERAWIDEALTVGAGIEIGACRVTRQRPHHAAFISGDLDAAVARLAPGANAVGLCDFPRSDAYAIRISRDQALLVTASPLEPSAGWHGSFALSPADDRFITLGVTGPGARGVLAQGTSADLGQGSPSAAIFFCGGHALLIGAENGYTLWIEAAYRYAVTTFLRSAQPIEGPVSEA
ncbi:MAG: hypothetical protein AAF646_07260 [Pseudomonadota bacterium]